MRTRELETDSQTRWSPWLLTASALLAALVLCETLPRLVPKYRPRPRTYVGDYPNTPKTSMIEDSVLGWTMQPNVRHEQVTEEFHVVYETNAQGFRSPYDFAAATAEQRVAIVGDSFTFGVGVAYAQTFGALLDAHLSQARVENFGHAGFAVDQMWLTARHYALPLRPALLIVCVISRDFDRSLEAYRLPEGWNKPVFHLRDGALMPRTAADRPPAWVRALQQYSVLWTLGWHVSRTVAQHLPHGEWWRLNIALLQQIAADAQAQHTPLLFVFLPTMHEPRFPALRRYMRHHNLPFLDLSEFPVADRQQLYYRADGHFTPQGHQWVAAHLVAWMQRQMAFLE